ncbi:hypothetical protein BDA99DRAFT_537607 [Phascolomyces articulosus]|uniref:Uncharacterized protein n=1 Tax=Phascolomyces articulosus TaxID=60185 RepID=A0AAD5PDY5_9FUNG|nr:hypothetical protein BDA99DRAFT_537607 [Phascolomyces articulosus]
MQQDKRTSLIQESICSLDPPSEGRYDDEDIERMDRLSQHPNRKATLDMFQRKTNTILSAMKQEEKSPPSSSSSSSSSLDEGPKAPPPSPTTSSSSSRLPISNRSSSLPRSPSVISLQSPVSISRQQRSTLSLRRSKANVYRFSHHPPSASVVHQTILEDDGDDMEEEKETMSTTTQAPSVPTSPLSPTFIRSKKRQSSTITLRSDQTLWSTYYNDDSTIPSTSSIIFEKLRDDTPLVSRHHNNEEQVNIHAGVSTPSTDSENSQEKGKDVIMQQSNLTDNIPHCPADIEEVIPWIGTLNTYITQTKSEIQHREQELVKLRQELKLLEEVRVRAKQKVQVDKHRKKIKDGNTMTDTTKEGLLFTIRKQAVNCIHNLSINAII